MLQCTTRPLHRIGSGDTEGHQTVLLTNGAKRSELLDGDAHDGPEAIGRSSWLAGAGRSHASVAELGHQPGAVEQAHGPQFLDIDDDSVARFATADEAHHAIATLVAGAPGARIAADAEGLAG